MCISNGCLLFSESLQSKFNYLFPIDEELIYEIFEYFKNLNVDPKIFIIPKKYLSSFSNKKFAINYKYTGEEGDKIDDYFINRSVELNNTEFAKLNLIRDEQKEKEALQYITNKKYNL